MGVFSVTAHACIFSSIGVYAIYFIMYFCLNIALLLAFVQVVLNVWKSTFYAKTFITIAFEFILSAPV